LKINHLATLNDPIISRRVGERSYHWLGLLRICAVKSIRSTGNDWVSNIKVGNVPFDNSEVNKKPCSAQAIFLPTFLGWVTIRVFKLSSSYFIINHSSTCWIVHKEVHTLFLKSFRTKTDVPPLKIVVHNEEGRDETFRVIFLFFTSLCSRANNVRVKTFSKKKTILIILVSRVARFFLTQYTKPGSGPWFWPLVLAPGFGPWFR
jgi:hypothetical protein